MASGSIVADFAGTLREARAYAEEHGVCAPLNRPYREAQAANGCACVSVPYTSYAQRDEAVAKIESLGWGAGEWRDTGPSRAQ